MDLHLVPWGAIITALSAVVGFIVWLVRLEGKTGSNRREIEITNEKVHLTNARVAVTEAALTELRATAITRTDLKEVEERVTSAVDKVGHRVTSELDRFVTVIGTKSTTPRTRTSR